MASVFLSYDRTDSDRARLIAAALEKAGHAVWWDRHIAGGAQFSKEIEAALKAADAVVVLWSAQSVESAWVRDEAAAGRDSARLVPVLIDNTEPPLGFRQYQSIDLSGWKGRGRAPRLEDLTRSIAALSASPAATTGGPLPVAKHPAHGGGHRVKLAVIIAALVIVVAATLFVLRGRPERSIQTVAVAAADASAEPLARDLLVKLGSLQSAQSGSMQLVRGDRDKSKSADLLFEIGGDPSAATPAATLVLTTGDNRNVLWSADLTEDRGGLADLKQRAAFTAARVLGCVLEATAPGESSPLAQDALKLYLNACALLGDTDPSDSSQLISALQTVIRQAPRFKPAWAKFLVAQTARYQDAGVEERKEIAADFRRHIAAARQIDPNMPEAFLAELELIPAPFFFDQIKLADQALKAGPENPLVLSGRALALLVVGRLDAAVHDARRAKILDPLSPAIRNQYIQALAFVGRIDAAKAELAEAEKLWPGASTVLFERFRLNSRIGDPTDALQLIRSGAYQGNRGLEAFLEARIQPTKPNVDRAIQLAMSNRTESADWLAEVIQALGQFDKRDEAFAILLAHQDAREIPYFVDTLFRPPQASLRADPRFMLVASRFGLVDYWRRSGDWPDFCADPDLPYDCQAEAAKLG
ncbi:MAG: toll/interleukin-1 receptor domain-containing protein [Sphingomicrobium sp.]